jgi:D-alanine-D-alanine ligase
MNIGVFFGGKNPEHEVSIITGQLIMSELKKLGYGIVPVYIDKNGLWKSDHALSELKFFTSPEFESAYSKLPKVNLGEFGGNRLLLKQNKLTAKTFSIDLAFPALHGSYGEDGTLQGLFEMAGIPYVGCEVTASAVAIDKVMTKRIFQNLEIPTPKFQVIAKTEWTKTGTLVLTECIDKLYWPIVVKPTRLGSSIGVKKVDNKEDLETAIEVALKYGEEVVLEKAVPNLKDLTCCVIGNHDLEASLVQESKFGDTVFSYDEKYLKEGGTQFGSPKSGICIPADILPETSAKIQDLSKKIFKQFGCSGIARVDFLLDQISQELFAIEINPLPGTLYHHLWKASGKPLDILIQQLISLAQERYTEKKNYTSSFPSDILRFANSKKLQLTGK